MTNATLLMRKVLVATLSAMTLVIFILPTQTAQAQRRISFSGYTWKVKSDTSRLGPGPNYFSDSRDNVRVDKRGRLHLSIVKSGAHWTCGEVANLTHLGYGTYRWTVHSDVSRLDPNAVLGLFTWSDDPAYAHREIDIEYAQWGRLFSRVQGLFTVQDGSEPSLFHRDFHVRPELDSVQTMTWMPGRVSFSATFADRTIRWTTAGAHVPVPGDELTAMNLWLLQGRAPQRDQQVVISDFSFRPAT